MTDLFFDTALVGGAWATDVRLAVARSGEIARVEAGASPRGAERRSGIALPGVPNVHSHAFQRAMAGLTERGSDGDDTFWSWRDRMYAFLEHLGPDDVEAIAAQLYVELLRHGFTAVAEFHYLRNGPSGEPYDDPVEMGRRIDAAARTAGIGLTLLPALYRSSGFGGEATADTQKRFTATVSELIADIVVLAEALEPGQARAGLALHSLRAVPPSDLAAAVDTLRGIDSDAPIHIHVAEQLREVEECLAWSGARPVEWLLEHAPVDERWCLVHATHLSDEETAALAASGASVGLCPTTEANLGDGIFPFAEYAEVGGAWGVGTDSHVSVSPVAELRMLEYGQRVTRRARNIAAGERRRSTGRALLDGALDAGARACGRPIGRIADGYRADVVVLDADHPSLVGRYGDDVVDSWIFAGDDTPVRDVMVGGRWIVEGGRHVREDDVLAEYRSVAERLGREGGA